VIFSLFNQDTFVAKLSRSTVAICAGCSILSLSPIPAYPQSIGPDYPIPLTTQNISGTGSIDQNLVYYYSFTAKPGKMTIDLNLNAENRTGNNIAIEIYWQTPDGKDLDTLLGYATPEEPLQTAKTLEFRSRTPVIMKIQSIGGATAGYNYQLKIDGEWVERSNQK
jgi:hypothetical protein